MKVVGLRKRVYPEGTGLDRHSQRPVKYPLSEIWSAIWSFTEAEMNVPKKVTYGLNIQGCLHVEKDMSSRHFLSEQPDTAQ